jgi:hypothetical protein
MRAAASTSGNLFVCSWVPASAAHKVAPTRSGIQKASDPFSLCCTRLQVNTTIVSGFTTELFQKNARYERFCSFAAQVRCNVPALMSESGGRVVNVKLFCLLLPASILAAPAMAAEPAAVDTWRLQARVVAPGLPGVSGGPIPGTPEFLPEIANPHFASHTALADAAYLRTLRPGGISS